MEIQEFIRCKLKDFYPVRKLRVGNHFEKAIVTNNKAIHFLAKDASTLQMCVAREIFIIFGCSNNVAQEIAKDFVHDLV